ncbi:MAG: helix-hairpin-helix domain-containing protein [Phycisphaerae bacterium]|nr:helix-hairpin-helix domain-containing protein [Phycisphaerae bacterium]
MKRIMNGTQTSFQNSPSPKDILLWTKAYRFAAVVALILLTFMIGDRICISRGAIPVTEPERINPNTAPVGSLVRLPGIGRARALDILHFRQTNTIDEVVFKTADDLQAIRGIGPKTAENIAPWLEFDEE